jgi:hypothetical protein
MSQIVFGEEDTIYLDVLTDKALQFVGATFLHAVAENVRECLFSK